MPSLEGNSSHLDGDYKGRSYAVYKCYKAAREKGWSVFAVSDEGQCRSSANAADIYQENGMSSKCSYSFGLGYTGVSDVYFATGQW